MTKIILSGCFGRMGKTLGEMISATENCEVAAGVDIALQNANFPVYQNISNVSEAADVIIDFSNPSNLDSLLSFATQKKIPLVLATTGYSEEQIAKIKDAAKVIPLFFSFNMSLGVNLIIGLAKKATEILGDAFDIEIIEKHHNQKIDAPSGTAIMIANAIDEVKGNSIFEYDRHSKRQKRLPNEIGIHSVRGGTIVGEHEIIFAGEDETVSITHTATSRKVFATGALKAAIYLSKIKDSGIYNMNNLING